MINLTVCAIYLSNNRICAIPANLILGRKFVLLIVLLQIFHYSVHKSIWVLAVSNITIVCQFWKKKQTRLHKIVTLSILHQLPKNSSKEMLQICFANDFKTSRRNFGRVSGAPLKQASCMCSIGGEMHSSIILCNKTQLVLLLFPLSMLTKQFVVSV